MDLINGLLPAFLGELMTTSLETLTAIMEERFGALNKALILQSKEYERRLDTLNHEAQRIHQAQSVSVTAEKFEDYVKTQQRALEIALKTMDDRYAVLTQASESRIDVNTNRLTKLEDSQAYTRTQNLRDISERDRKSDHLNAWMIAVMGAILTIIVISSNLLLR